VADEGADPLHVATREGRTALDHGHDLVQEIGDEIHGATTTGVGQTAGMMVGVVVVGVVVVVIAGISTIGELTIVTRIISKKMSMLVGKARVGKARVGNPTRMIGIARAVET